MITIQGFRNSKDSIFILFDTNGIDEMIDYLKLIRDSDSSMHLTEGNELTDDNEIEDDMYAIPHLKIINIDNLDND